MLAAAYSATLHGLDAFPVRVEVDASRGVPSFDLVGLAEIAVRESRVRVKSALAQVGVDLSEYRVLVNLAPADLRKYGSAFDVAIAVAVLAALQRVPHEALARTMLLGELSLSGGIHPVRGVLPYTMGARARRFSRVIVPVANEAEAALVDGVDVFVASHLAELARALSGELELARARPADAAAAPSASEDLSDVRGQIAARRALEIAAAGGHNLLMIGPPGAGKTMLARRVGGILPPLEPAESLEVMTIHSVAGLLRGARQRMVDRPFRAPHHTASDIALVGGGEPPRPGEVSLAHQGVLFLDELAEWKRSALEALRQPLEDGVVTVSRARGTATFYARPMLVAATNPCPCGFLGDSLRCGCSETGKRAYRARLSGPLLDRIDVHVVLPPVDPSSIVETSRTGESSAAVRDRVLEARARQADRYARGVCGARCNATLAASELDAIIKLDDAARAVLVRSTERQMLSARAFSKVLRVARTIADLAGSEPVLAVHASEAVLLRAFDRGVEKRADAA